MKLINCTPHPVVLQPAEGWSITLEPSGIVARAATARVADQVIMVEDMPITIYRVEFGEVQELPEPQEDTLYIVSSIVARACPDRRDLVVPDDTIRDAEGRIVAARALARV